MYFWGCFMGAMVFKNAYSFYFLHIKFKIIDVRKNIRADISPLPTVLKLWTLSRACFTFQMRKPAINTERAREHDKHSERDSRLFRLLQETAVCGCVFVHWLVRRWPKKVFVWGGVWLLCITRAQRLCQSAGKPHRWGTLSSYRINRSPRFLPSLKDLAQAGPGALTRTSSKMAGLQFFWN